MSIGSKINLSKLKASGIARMRQKKFNLTLMLFAFFYAAVSQGNIYFNKLAKNTILIEVVGSSGSNLSLQYDRIIKQLNKSFFNATIGIGYFPSLNAHFNPIYGLPCSLNWTSGLKKHHLEIGLGITYTNGIIQVRDSIPPQNKAESLKAVFSTFKISYKYQRKDGGFFLKIGFTPLIQIYRFSKTDVGGYFIPLAGVSLGYTIK